MTLSSHHSSRAFAVNCNSATVCPVCRNTSIEVFYHLRPVFQRSVLNCKQCGTKFSNPPTFTHVGMATVYYSSKGSQEQQENTKRTAIAHLRAIKNVADLQCISPPRILEIGCSYGHLLRLLRDETTCRVEGIELSRDAVEHARRNGLIVHRKNFETFDSATKYGMVISVHVLEHLLDPVGYFDGLGKLLERRGIAVCITPNGHAFLFALLGKFWAWATIEEHNLFLTPAAARILAERTGFRLVTVCNTNRTSPVLMGFASFAWKLLRHCRLRNSEHKEASLRYLDPGALVRLLRKVISLLDAMLSFALLPFYLLLKMFCRSDELIIVLAKEK